MGAKNTAPILPPPTPTLVGQTMKENKKPNPNDLLHAKHPDKRCPERSATPRSSEKPRRRSRSERNLWPGEKRLTVKECKARWKGEELCEDDTVVIQGLFGSEKRLNGRTAVVLKKHPLSGSYTVNFTSPRGSDDGATAKLKFHNLEACRQEAFDVMDVVMIQNHPETRINGRRAIVSKVLPYQRYSLMLTSPRENEEKLIKANWPYLSKAADAYA